MNLAETTNHQLTEQLWRLNNLYTIIDKQGRSVPFRMNSAQDRFYREMWYRNSILKSRQHGFSTLIALYALDTCLFWPNTAAGFIAHGLEEAKKIFATKIDYPWQQLPEGLRNRVGSTTDSKTELAFGNNSSISVGTSMRSGTVQVLHVSEFGKIAATRPDKAREVITGAFEAVPQDGVIFVESTAEGNEGAFYDLDQNARKLTRALTPMDFKAHFYPWFEDPQNTLDADIVIDEQYNQYFAKLEELGICLSEGQKHWYVVKARTLQEEMQREHPSTAEEAFAAAIEGAWFSRQMARMRRDGRLGKVPYNASLPVHTFWDLGYNDQMSIWFHQRMGSQNHLIDYYEDHLQPPEHYADILRNKPYTYMMHYCPHDVTSTHWSVGKPGDQVLMELGVRPITKVARPKNKAEVLGGINATREFLDSCWIDEEKCAKGIKGLDNYRMEWDEKAAAFRDTPLHNWASHPADSLRTGATAFEPIGKPKPIKYDNTGTI